MLCHHFYSISVVSGNPQPDQAIGQEHRFANLHILEKMVVVDVHDPIAAFESAGPQRQVLAIGDRHATAGETADAELRTLDVLKDGDRPIGRGGTFSHPIGELAV